MIDWFWKLYKMAFERVVVPENWGTAVIVPFHEGKRERTALRTLVVLL